MPYEDINESQNPNQRFAHDDKLFVVFSMKAVKNGFRSEEEGRPIFDDVEHIRIHVPGDKTTIVDEPVTDEHRMRFASRYERFRKGMEQVAEGTPLEQWPILTVGQVQEFKYQNIHTVEQLATLSDAHAQKFMGGNGLKRKAIAFLEVSKDTAAAQKYVTLNAELNERLATQQKQIDEQAAQIAILMMSQKTGDNPAPSAPQPNVGKVGNEYSRAAANRR